MGLPFLIYAIFLFEYKSQTLEYIFNFFIFTYLQVEKFCLNLQNQDNMKNNK